jgi:L-asparagine transporter-like permease
MFKIFNNKNFFKFQFYFFNFFLITSWILIIFSYFQLSQRAPKLLETIDYYMRIYICIFLILRFNPFRRVEFNNLDQQIAFQSGILILTTTALNKYLQNARERIQELRNEINIRPKEKTI